jgi:predicted kinase
VPTLLHLNGPPGIGKSTLSALWAERHPGTLNLDIDVLHPLIGGWRDPEQDTHALARPLAKAMAAAYLATGHDVVLPQYLGRLDEIESFERIAHEQGAELREVVLLDDKPGAIARFDQRRDDTAWNQHNRRVVADLGGEAFLADMYDRLLVMMAVRPAAVVVRSVPDAVEETYLALEQALTVG